MHLKSILMTRTLRALTIVALIGALASCSNDDTPNYSLQARAVDSISIPDTVAYMQDYNFKVYYEKLGTCDEFNGFNVSQGDEDNEYIISVIATVYDDERCETYDTPKIEEHDLPFTAQQKDSLNFKFWQGVDEEEAPIYLEKTIFVSDPINNPDE